MAGTPSGPSARNRWIALGGAALALIAGLAIAILIVHRNSGARQAPPASQGGLVVQTGRDDDIKLDPKRPLRCFVGGQFVGELMLADCARRNGVATGSLDVGLDPTGSLAAAGGGGSNLTPLPTPPDVGAQDPAPPMTRPAGAELDAQPADQTASDRPHAVAGCLRAEDGQWTVEPGPGNLSACARALFGGVCLRRGEARFGRFGSVTLRLFQSRVSIAPDGRNFRPLVDQDENCALPPPD